MNEEIKIKYEKKLKELREKVRLLNIHRGILENISRELERDCNPHLSNLIIDIDFKEEISYLNDWIEFHSGYVARCRQKIHDLGKYKYAKIQNIREDFTKEGKKSRFRKPVAYASLALILLLIATSFFVLKPSVTGHVVLGKESAYNKTLNLKLNQSGNYTLALDKNGIVTSIKATGSVTGNGSVKIYIEKEGKKYLIYNNLGSS